MPAIRTYPFHFGGKQQTAKRDNADQSKKKYVFERSTAKKIYGYAYDKQDQNNAGCWLKDHQKRYHAGNHEERDKPSEQVFGSVELRIGQPSGNIKNIGYF